MIGELETMTDTEWLGTVLEVQSYVKSMLDELAQTERETIRGMKERLAELRREKDDLRWE